MTETTAQERLDAMIAKVEKIMRKAERTTNPEEAATFFENAQRLMAKHGIDENTLRLSEPEIPAEKVIHNDMVIKRSGFFESMVRLASVCAEANDVRVLIKTPSDWGVHAGVRFVGLESSIVKAKMLYVSLLAQCMRERRNIPGSAKYEAETAEMMGNGTASHYLAKWRRDFSLGFASRIGDRLREIKRSVESEAIKSDGRMLPMLQDQRAEVTRYYESMVGAPRRTGGSRQGPNAGAFGAGSRAADRADLGQPRTGSGTAGALQS